MDVHFDAEDIVSVEFIVCFETDGDDLHYLVPVDRSVQSLLRATLASTINQLDFSEPQWERFEPSQKYDKKERLQLPVNDDQMSRIQQLYTTEGWTENPDVMDDLNDLIYYYCVFRDSANRKFIGVRKASIFKRMLGQKNRMIRLIDNTLHAFNENIFTVDKDFDFVMDSVNAYILRPDGFEYVADLENIALEMAQAKTLELGSRINCVDFNDLSLFVSSRKKAARIISGLHVRNNLESITKDRLQQAARAAQVSLEETAIGKLKPSRGSEMDFLEILDDRRYTTSLTDEGPLTFKAANRKPIPHR